MSVAVVGSIVMSRAQAQTLPPDRPLHVDVGAQAIGVVTRASPALRDRTLTEGYLTQPALMTHAGFLGDALTLTGTLNLEGLTLDRGELNAGIYGEGYVDRRHPHTYLHELVLTAAHDFSSLALSVSAGKGFAPFGTDDPMARPFEKYPINHHLAQILERVVAIAAVRAGGLAIEGGLFNGDEPEGAGDVPNRDRYWDSWSARLSYAPFPQAEIQSSYGRVKSPEIARGGGADQRKRSASVRLEDAQRSGYALIEWARTDDYVGSARTVDFTTLLIETAARYGRVTGGLRFERTDRPDEERLANPFRTPLPGSDLSTLGRSRWNVLTARAAALFRPAAFAALEPFAEVARANASPSITRSLFDPRQFYGSSRIWSVSAGAKITLGMAHLRMGRYGVARLPWRGSTMSHAGMNMEHSGIPNH